MLPRSLVFERPHYSQLALAYHDKGILSVKTSCILRADLCKYILLNYIYVPASLQSLRIPVEHERK